MNLNSAILILIIKAAIIGLGVANCSKVHKNSNVGKFYCIYTVNKSF